MPLPKPADAKVTTGVPLRVTLAASAGSTPTKVGVPLNVALVVRSYDLLSAAKPLIVTATAEFTVIVPAM